MNAQITNEEFKKYSDSIFIVTAKYYRNRNNFLIIAISFIVVLCSICLSEQIDSDKYHKKSIFENDSIPTGLYIGTPKSFYSTYSAFGLQAGYQFHKHLNLRLQYSVVLHHQEGVDTWFQLPSISLYYSTIGRWAPLRCYLGFTFGAQKGLSNSFKKEAFFVNAVDGVEFYALKKKSFYLEVGPGIAFPVIEGAYQGGVIMEAGCRFYL